MSKVTWVCFDCRQAVRREATYEGDVVCAHCGKTCHCLGHKIPTPRKSAVKQWEALRQSLSELRRKAAEDRFFNRVKYRHAIEQEILRLEALPSNSGHAKAIRLLRRRLEGA